MLKLKNVGYSLRDVSIVPAVVSDIASRSECNPFTKICERECYPIFVAPMGAVTDENNYGTWINNKLTPVVPRTVSQRLSLKERLEISEKTFVSISLSEAEDFLNFNDEFVNKRYICIDLANGHIKKLLEICKSIKEKYSDKVCIMTGNIANPKTYIDYCNAKIDYVRVGIGGGSRCTTSANVSIHYPMASLLDGIVSQKELLKSYNDVCDVCEVTRKERFYTKIVADGGIYNFDDINKCLALGADAVMIGRVFAECIEACGDVLYCYDEEQFKLGIGYTKDELETANYFIHDKVKPYREYYGMSTKKAQKETNGSGTKTAEGISKPVLVKHNVSKWIDNMESYLKSAMSYTNCKTIDEFNNKCEIIILGGSGDLSYRK